jgi:quercetin dioxygenase-like cupin family protein
MTPQTVAVLDHSPAETARGDSQQTTQQAGAGGGKAKTDVARQNLARYVPAGTGPAYWGPGNQLTFLITGKETGGAFFLAEMSVEPGGGPPPHIHHREDESFHILEGTLTIQVGGNTITASAGDFAFLPRGIVHSFKNTGDGCAKALVLTTPAGLENYFAEVFEPAADRDAAPPPPSKAMMARAMAAAPRYDLELLPPA